MPKQRNYTFKLYPTEEQAKKLELFISHCRFVWNKFIEINKERLDRGEKILKPFEAIKLLIQLKKQKEYEFLKETPVSALNNTILALHVIFTPSKVKAYGIPAFRKKGTNSYFSIKKGKKNKLNIKNKQIKISRLGFIDLNQNAKIEGEVRSYQVIKGVNSWNVTIKTKLEEPDISSGPQDLINKKVFNKSFKFRLEPNKQQENRLNEYLEQNRLIWNHFVVESLKEKDQRERTSNFYSFVADLTKLLQLEENSILLSTPRDFYEVTLKNLNFALDCFHGKYALMKNTNFPKIKKQGEMPSINIRRHFKIKQNKLNVPRIGYIKFKKSREFIGNIKNITIKKELQKWYILILTEIEQEIPKNKKTDIGLDLGVTNIITCSNGKKFDGIKDDKKLVDKARKIQTKFNKQKEGFKNRQKTKLKLQQIHKKIQNKRYDYRQKITTQIVNNHNNIFMEDLKVKQMTTHQKGTAKNPNKGTKAKAIFNSNQLIQGWGQIKELLLYKALRQGGTVTLLRPNNTSIGCRKCGYVDPENRKTQSKFICLGCGHKENADVHASKNILALGLRVNVLGEKRVNASMNKKPTQSC